ncbi:MAG: RNA methyltransferase [Bdellovibrionales bacterium]|nr:RNA methyltransferase [Bdellovibrionales bacterium]
MNESRSDLYLGLVHWPIKDKAGSIICTNVTNFDVHDIARASRTYGVKQYHIINKVPEQQMFVSRLVEHWTLGTGARYNPMRKTALGIVKPFGTLEESLASFEQQPLVIATSARSREGVKSIGFADLRKRLWDPQRAEQPLFLIFGTGFGLADSIYEHCDLLLEPIRGDSMDDYRHLSVRSAVSICLDRLLGAW